jgi:hypothetical protein
VGGAGVDVGLAAIAIRHRSRRNPLQAELQLVVKLHIAVPPEGPYNDPHKTGSSRAAETVHSPPSGRSLHA